MLHRYFILTIILRVIVEYITNMRVLHIEGAEIGDSAASRGNLWRTDSWALKRRRSSHSSVISFSIACKVECFLPESYSEILTYLRTQKATITSLHHCHDDLYHIIKRPFKVNSNCSLILVELSLCALTTLLVYLLFELRLVVCRLWSTTVRFPFTSLKLPPRIVTFEHPAKKDPMIRNFKTE